MEEVVESSHLNAFGCQLTCRFISYNKYSRCNEFVIEKQPIKIHRWLGTSVFVSITSYLCKFYTMSFFVQLFILICLGLAVAILIHCKVQKESLLVISSVGLQITTTFVSGRNVCCFVGNSKISGVVINEVITMQCVLYYLTLLTRSPKQSMVPLFQCTMPRLEYLRKIYVTLDAMIVNEKRKIS